MNDVYLLLCDPKKTPRRAASMGSNGREDGHQYVNVTNKGKDEHFLRSNLAPLGTFGHA